MIFAFDVGDTLTRYPTELWTIMECLRLGGHRVIVLSAIGADLVNPREHVRLMLRALGFNFSPFEIVTVVEDFTGQRKAEYCRDHDVCMLIDNAPYNMEGLRKMAPKTARILVAP